MLSAALDTDGRRDADSGNQAEEPSVDQMLISRMIAKLQGGGECYAMCLSMRSCLPLPSASALPCLPTFVRGRVSVPCRVC